MEDRIGRNLYLELSNRANEHYARERVPEVLELADVERATWWQNQKPGRTEFPRTIEEFTTLGLYEAGDEFAAPQTPSDIRGLHFRHYPRPGQGILTGKPTLGLELVLISPREPSGAQALRDWGDFIHLRYIAAAAVEGFTMITPYENVAPGPPRFMHLYEMDTADAEQAFQRMTPTTRERQIGPQGGPLWKRWAGHEQLVIDYVNTFARIGELAASVVRR